MDTARPTHDLEGDRVHACTMVERLWCVCMHAVHDVGAMRRGCAVHHHA